MEGYCMKHKKKMKMVGLKKEKSNGKTLVRGKCSKCGTNMAVFTK